MIEKRSSIIRCWHPLNTRDMTTTVIFEERGSHWSQQISVVATTWWSQCGQTLPLLCETAFFSTLSHIPPFLPTCILHSTRYHSYSNTMYDPISMWIHWRKTAVCNCFSVNHEINKTGTSPHGISGVAVLVDQHIAKNCLVLYSSFKDSTKSINNLTESLQLELQQNTNDLLSVQDF